jgi:hypothetical protein
MFPLSLCFAKLNTAQKAMIRISRKAVVKRMKQLKLTQEYVKDIRLKTQELHVQFATFKQIAQSLHKIVVETETEG